MKNVSCSTFFLSLFKETDHNKVCRRSLPKHFPTSSGSFGSQRSPATRSPPRLSPPPLICWGSATGRGRRSTVLRSSNPWSLTLESVVPSICKVIWRSLTSASWSKKCRYMKDHWFPYSLYSGWNRGFWKGWNKEHNSKTWLGAWDHHRSQLW